MGGDRLEYPDDASSPAAYLVVSKLLFNSTISDACRVARFMSCDLNFFLGNPNVKSRVHKDTLKIFPTRHQRPIRDWGTHSGGWICVHKIIKGMYGLKQAAIIAYNQLIFYMGLHGYYPVPFTTGLRSHKTRKTNLLICGWLWSKILFQRLCKSSPTFPKKALCGFNVLGGTQLPRIDDRLEL